MSPVDDAAHLATGMTLLGEIGFLSRDYLERYEDLRRAGLGEGDATRHFVQYGLGEGRRFRFEAPLARAVRAVHQAALPEALRTALVRQLARARVEEAGTDGQHPERLADALVSSPVFTPLLVVGDSHARLYDVPELLTPDGGEWLPLPYTCWAGSARGLDKASARAGYGPRILGFVRAHAAQVADAGATVLMKFGQVDVEFAYNFKRLGPPPERMFRPLEYLDFVTDCADRYVGFLLKVRAALPTGVPLVAASIFPPTLSDVTVRAGYVIAHVAELEDAGEAEAIAEALRSFELPGWRTRTLFHALFNRELSLRCDAEGIAYLDDFTPFLGPEGVVAEHFIEPHRGADHHLPPNDATRAVIASLGARLKSLVRGD